MTGSRKLTNATPLQGSMAVRLSNSDKHAIVLQLRRLCAGERVGWAQVQQVANHYGITARSVSRWVRNEAFQGDLPPTGNNRKRFEVTIDHLTVVANEQNARDGFNKLTASGLIDCSYPTFSRALKRADPGLVQAALKGYKGLVNSRLYLKVASPHRGHTYHLDHTVLDLYVWASHRHKVPMRPYVTVIVDAYSGLIWAFPWYQPVNGDMVAAALAEAGSGREYHGIEIGGQPEQVVLDNAGEHFAPSMRDGISALGWIVSPTGTYSSWQNGKAERVIGLMNEKLSKKAPGATNAGTLRNGAPRHGGGSTRPGGMKPEDVWSAATFEVALQAVVDEINTTIPVERLGGLTRLEAYATDQTERRPLEPAIARLAMMTSGDLTHKATKAGIRFQNRDYVSSHLQYGKRYLIRYLPTMRSFIEVFTETNEHVCRAWLSDDLPPNERNRFMAERARQERDAKAIEAGVIAHRRHEAALANEGIDYELPDDRQLPEVTGHLPGRDPEQGKTVVTPRRKQPRVPISDPPESDDIQATVAFLAERFPDALPQSPEDSK